MAEMVTANVDLAFDSITLFSDVYQISRIYGRKSTHTTKKTPHQRAYLVPSDIVGRVANTKAAATTNTQVRVNTQQKPHNTCNREAVDSRERGLQRLGQWGHTLYSRKRKPRALRGTIPQLNNCYRAIVQIPFDTGPSIFPIFPSILPIFPSVLPSIFPIFPT